MSEQVTLQSTPAQRGFPGGTSGKNPRANAGQVTDTASIPGSGRSPGRANGNPLRYSCLENPMDGGVWGATVHRVEKSQTELRQLSSNRQHKELEGCPTQGPAWRKLHPPLHWWSFLLFQLLANPFPRLLHILLVCTTVKVLLSQNNTGITVC